FMWRNFLWASAVVASLASVGCRPPSSASTKYVIAVVPKGRTHEFWQSIERGARRAAADLGKDGVSVQVLYEGPVRESDATDQISIVQQMMGSRGVSGLVLAPQHSKAMVPVVKETNERGIPVVIIDSGLDEPDLYVKYVATNNENGGRMAARRLVEVLDKDGK